jgi:ATP-dependent Lon protease
LPSKNIENSTFLINFICSNTDISVEDKQNLLEIENMKDRGVQAISYLVKEVQMLELKHDIQKKVRTDMDRQQREFMLNQQMKTIQDELGGNPVEQEINALKEKAATKKWNAEVAFLYERGGKTEPSHPGRRRILCTVHLLSDPARPALE